MKHKNQMQKVGAVLLALTFWELAAVLVDQRILLVTPIAVAKRLCTIWMVPGFFQILGNTCMHIVGGYLLGVCIGTCLAFFAAKRKWVENLFWPWMVSIRSVPVAAFVVIALIWLSSAYLPVLICALVVIPVIYQNVLTGLRQTDVQLLEMAQVYHLSKAIQFRSVTLPCVQPYFLSGARVCAGMAWKAGVAAEIIAIPLHSVGKQMHTAKMYLDTDDLLAWTILVVVCSVVFERLCLWLLKLLMQRLTHPSHCTMQKHRTKKLCVKEAADDIALLHQVSKAYGEQVVLDGFDMEIPYGSCVALMGKSGSGKTTVMRILLGLEQANCGQVINRSESVSVVFQEHRLLPHMTGIENILLVMDHADADASEYVEQQAACIGLSADDLQKPIVQLSGGMKQRIAILRAVCARPKLLCLDEPFVQLDETTRMAVMEYVKSKSKDCAVLLITHKEEEARFFTQTVIEKKYH